MFKPTYILAFFLVSNSASGLEIGPDDDIRSAIAQLQPGDTLVLRDGTYNFNSGFRIEAVGTRTQPIRIEAQTGARPLLSMNTAAHNAVEVVNSQYLELHRLRITGGSHGIRLIGSDHVTIEECEIFETGDVAISANSGGTYTGLQILRNHIHHTNGTGEGMYLGCNYDDCRVEDSLIEGNYIHHTNRASVEQGDGIELKEGSSGNIIRHNVIHDTNYPGILVYGTAGNGPVNVIEGNVVWNTNDWALQVAADVRVINNIFLGEGVSFQAHQSSSPSNIEFVHNTVLATGDALSVRNITGPVTIANNALYSQAAYAISLISGDQTQVLMAANIGAGSFNGDASEFRESSGAEADLGLPNFGALPLNAYPRATGALINVADSRFTVSLDFNGAAREARADVGAYEFTTQSNPGWTVAESFKVLESSGVPKPPVLLP